MQTTTDPIPFAGPRAPDIAAVKAKLKATWEDGDYAAFAQHMEPGALEMLDRWRIAPGLRLLDVGCGAGQTAIPAARRGIDVTGVDIAENLIEHARRRAEADRLSAVFDVGDAEELPYADASFDAVLSLIGAMFAPRPDRVAAELARVTRSGGHLYMANWTPRGMPAQMFQCVAAFVPPPPGFISPALWGDEDTVRARLADGFKNITLTRRMYPRWIYPYTPAQLVDLFRTHFGPVKRAFDALDDDGRRALRQQLEVIYTRCSAVRDSGLEIINGEYLEIIATRR